MYTNWRGMRSLEEVLGEFDENRSIEPSAASQQPSASKPSNKKAQSALASGSSSPSVEPSEARSVSSQASSRPLHTSWRGMRGLNDVASEEFDENRPIEPFATSAASNRSTRSGSVPRPLAVSLLSQKMRRNERVLKPPLASLRRNRRVIKPRPPRKNKRLWPCAGTRIVILVKMVAEWWQEP